MSRRKYDPKLKADVIEAIIECGRSAAQVARDYDLAEHTVYSWTRAYKSKHDLAVIQPKNETLEQENARLKKELVKAKMQRDILKKATAYFASLDQ